MSTVYEVHPIRNLQNRQVSVTVPGSKSITNRALLLAAMADGSSTLQGCLTSEDAAYFLECLKTLGFPVIEESDGALGSNITITGFGGKIPKKEAEIYVGSAGTAARFLAAMLAFADGDYVLNSSEQMKKRPMGPLIDSLRDAGAMVICLEEEGHFPMKIHGTAGRCPRKLTVDIGQSSQFLSALLIAAGTLHQEVDIAVNGTHGLAYVDLTAEMMQHFGVAVTKEDLDGLLYHLTGTASYQAIRYEIEPDLSAAAYFYAMAALLGISVTVNGVHEQMLQGDMAFVELLERMGATRSYQDGILSLQGPNHLMGGFTVDLSAFSDQALTLAAIAPYATAPIKMTGIAHIRLQECDRIHAITKNLLTLGVETIEQGDEIMILPGKPHGGVVETFDDHRVAMSFALMGLMTEGVIIENPECCKKTFTQYFTVLEQVTEAITIGRARQ